MIDWITFVAPLPHDKEVTSGSVMALSTDGEIEWRTHKRKTLKGSFSTGLQVKTATHTETPCSHLIISGNPVKWFQGHNLWGTDDLPGLVLSTLEAVASALHLVVSDETRSAWKRGEVQITRVDCTESFHLSHRGEVLAWLRAAEQTAHLPHRGRGQLCKGSTLYFGKNSRRWSIKLYAKGEEIKAKGHGQDSILGLPSALAWADKTLRAELTIRSMELKRLCLSQLLDWFPVDGVPSVVTAQLLTERLGDMTMTTTKTLPDDVIQTLTAAQHHAYLAWLSGADLRDTMTRRSFYRMRSKLLPHGIDIATLMPKEVTNVVPLVRILEAVPAPVPDWAIGTPLYFEPPRVA